MQKRTEQCYSPDQQALPIFQLDSTFLFLANLAAKYTAGR